VARSDDDSWDITESVGATALAVAMSRAQESGSQCALFTDRYAQMFLDAAAEAGWQSPFRPEVMSAMADADPRLELRVKTIFDYGACRTKWFDDFFIAAGAAGITQSVILAAGLDARAWRLPWLTDSVVYEIDQPQVLAFKADTLARHGARAAAGYVAVPIDLRRDWPTALRDSGFDPDEPTAWSAEGLLPYLPPDAQDALFERIVELSAYGSRIAVEVFHDDEGTPAGEQRRTVMASMHRAAVDAGQDVPDTEDLFFHGPRTDVAEWLTGRGWQVSVTPAQQLLARYHREVPPDFEGAHPPSDFITAELNRYSES
jgi:methyltransferase (TIGR00027 family)